jgi:hypothetical protein
MASASLALLQARALEIRAVLPLLRAAVTLAEAKTAAARTLLPPPGAPPASAQGGSAAAGAGGGLGSTTGRLPTTLLSAVLDPRAAAQRRYSANNALRGADR